jgi:histidyl-tRNA synthetase
MQELDAFVAYASQEVYPQASALLARLRANGISADTCMPGRSLGKQMEDAGSKGARWAFVVGKAEISSGTVTLRDMVSGKEERLATEEAIRRVVPP